MKTKQNITDEINSLTKEGEQLKGSKDPKQKRLLKKIEKRLPLLRQILLFIDTAPSEESVIKMQTDLNRKKRLVDSGFEEWKKNTPKTDQGKTPLSKWRSINDYKTIKNQLGWCNYLLTHG